MRAKSANGPMARERWSEILGRLIRTGGDSERAEDHLQSAYMRMEEYRTKTPVQNEGAFLVRTALNIGIDERRRARWTVQPGPNLGGLLNLSDERPLQDEVLVARDRLRRISAGLNRLSPRTRDVFLMHRLDGLKYREIADRLGITQSAVEKHMAKATAFLMDWAQGW